MDPWLPHPQSVTALILAPALGDPDHPTLPAATDAHAEVERVAAMSKGRCGRVIVATAGDTVPYRHLGRVVTPSPGRSTSALACLEAGLKASTTPWLLLLPAGLPSVPDSVLAALLKTLRSQPNMRLVVPTDGERIQPWLAAIRRTTLPDLSRFIDAGGDDIFAWLDVTPHTFVNIASGPKAG